MVKFCSDDLFDTVKHAQTAGLLELLPPMKGRIAPGDRFFESFQAYLLETFDLEKLDLVLNNLAPTFRYMSEEKRWEPSEFTAEEFFDAVFNLRKMGVFDLMSAKLELPGEGDRFFEHYQRVLIDQIGIETMDRMLYTLGQCIRFLATDAALVNMKGEESV